MNFIDLATLQKQQEILSKFDNIGVDDSIQKIVVPATLDEPGSLNSIKSSFKWQMQGKFKLLYWKLVFENNYNTPLANSGYMYNYYNPSKSGFFKLVGGGQNKTFNSTFTINVGSANNSYIHRETRISIEKYFISVNDYILMFHSYNYNDNFLLFMHTKNHFPIDLTFDLAQPTDFSIKNYKYTSDTNTEQVACGYGVFSAEIYYKILEE